MADRSSFIGLQPAKSLPVNTVTFKYHYLSTLPIMAQNILLVEDEPALREVLTELLSMNGYIVASAEDGIEGFNKAVELQPDLIITDMRMPRMDGPMLASQLRSMDATSTIPVIFMSAFAAEFEVPATQVLQKPFSIDQLLVRIMRAL